MDGFKESEIGLIPYDWELFSFEDTIIKHSIGKKNQINASEILDNGKFPVVDQGQEYIAGYTNDEGKVIDVKKPVIIFGDHTRIFKFINFPFVLGADGTKVFIPNDKLFSSKFFYYYLKQLGIPSRGYNRHYKLLKEKTIPQPELDEQIKIENILTLVDDSINKQTLIIENLQELKKTLMQKLFTEGLNGEQLKDTEIGKIPESWEVVEFDDLLELKRGKDLPKDKFILGEYPVAGSNGIIGYHNAFNYPGNGVTVGRSGSVGKTKFYIEKFWAHNTVLAVHDFKNNDELFIYYYLGFLNLGRFASGVSVPTLNRNVFRQILVIKPTKEEQIEIGKNLFNIDEKNRIVNMRKQYTEKLFHSMLNQLMTGKKRVKDLVI